MKFQSVVLVVSNLERSRRFYEDLLDQRVLLDFGENISFDGFALQEQECWGKFLNCPASSISFGGRDAEVYFETEDFDGFLARLSAFPLPGWASPVEEYGWGQRTIRFADPDGHLVEVGQSMDCVIRRFLQQGLSVEETARRSQYPLDYVQRIAEEAPDSR